MTHHRTTEDLIRDLSARPAPAPFRPAGAAAAMLFFLLPGLGLFFLILGPRPDLFAAWQHLAVQAKTILPLALALLAGGLALRSGMPGRRVALWHLALPVLAALGLVLNRVMVADGPLLDEVMGQTAMACLASVTLLSVPALVAGVIWLRHAAPTRPALTGALVGLAVGSGAAAAYALHCTEDSPLFFVAWYGLAIAMVAAIGGGLGHRFLRW